MLEADALRIECALSHDSEVVDAGDYRFKPVADCSVCDEPTEVVYFCTNCDAALCPNCVSSTLNASVKTHALCPDCPGACCEVSA